MKVYFVGIGGTGIGPLAEFTKKIGAEVVGSDLKQGAISTELEAQKIDVYYGAQKAANIDQAQLGSPIDWLVYTSAVKEDHPEVKRARELGIRVTKRDEFLAMLINKYRLNLVAIAGTHGKTTTTAMLIWVAKQLKQKINYLVGTTLGWAPSSHFTKDAKYLVYEADEYDRAFLRFWPKIAALTKIDYDHQDIYPTKEDYKTAFRQFEQQSEKIIRLEDEQKNSSKFNLVGELRRQDAALALATAKEMFPELSETEIIEALNCFPGAGRRFEEIAPGVISDYAHHPSEIKMSVEMAHELKQKGGYRALAIIYEPHQNARQIAMKDAYKEVFMGVDKIFWLETFLTREEPEQRILSQQELIDTLANKEVAEAAKMDATLAQKLKALQEKGWLIVLLSAGPADSWLRRVDFEK